MIVSLSSILKIIGEESRLKILCLLKEKPHCVCEMISHLKLSQSLISHHLRDLKDANFVKAQKNGVKVYYSLTKNGEYVTNLLFKLL
ncbi:MAG: ArsR/SmtB family transcription factor [Microgenomates group bacterium]